MADNNSYTRKEIDLMIKNISENTDKLLTEMEKVNHRISNLEKWRAYLTGAVAVIMVLGLPDVISLLSA